MMAILKIEFSLDGEFEGEMRVFGMQNTNRDKNRW
jgi:hypothetical protein